MVDRQLITVDSLLLQLHRYLSLQVTTSSSTSESESGYAGASGMLEPIMLRSTAKRDTFAWKRGETTASPAQLMAFNGLTAENLVKRALELVG